MGIQVRHFIVFLLGVGVSVAFEQILDHEIDSPEVLVSFLGIGSLFLLISIAVVFYLGLNEAKLASTLKLGESKLELMEERLKTAILSLENQAELVVDSFDGDSHDSACYARLERLIDAAETSVLVIPNPYRDGGINTWESPPRVDYMQAIERKLLEKSKKETDFEYFRVQQISKANFSEFHPETNPTHRNHLLNSVGKTAVAHIQRVLERRLSNVRIAYTLNDEISGQMIVDKKIFVKFITGVDDLGRKRLVAVSIMKNSHNDDIRNYYDKLKSALFCTVYPITKAMLKGGTE